MQMKERRKIPEVHLDVAGNRAPGDVFENEQQRFVMRFQRERRVGRKLVDESETLRDPDLADDGNPAFGHGGGPAGRERHAHLGGNRARSARFHAAQECRIGDARHAGRVAPFGVTVGDHHGIVHPPEQIETEGDHVGTDDAAFLAVAARTMVLRAAVVQDADGGSERPVAPQDRATHQGRFVGGILHQAAFVHRLAVVKHSGSRPGHEHLLSYG